VLIEKITACLTTWAKKSISFAGRAQLINSIIFGMYNYWATIFMLPKDVTGRITQLCRQFLWGGSPDSRRVPSISWATTCLLRKYGGYGVRNLTLWNQASIAKPIWVVATKKDNLWVKWVHGKYLKMQDWWTYHPPPDCNWY